MLGSQRHLFDLPADISYINCAYFGPFMRHAREAGIAGLDRRLRPWTIERRHFYEDVERVRALFARLVGAGAPDIALAPSSSYAVAVAAANLELARGKAIVVPANEHSSNFYAWHRMAASCGGRLVVVERPADWDWTSALLARIDGATGLVATPPCHWSDGALIDLEAIGAAARSVGAALVVDATQTLGARPFDVARVRPDFLVCSAYKWLFSPYTLAFLYAAPHRQDGAPIEHHGFNRAGAASTANTWQHVFEYEAGARRYDMGERSNFISLPMAIAALEQLHAWTIEAIARTIAPMAAAIASGAAELGLDSPPAAKRVAHILGLVNPRGWAPDITARLLAEGVSVSLRGDRLRVSPHVYNDMGDVDRLMRALRKCL
jgi:selenocysteine lyase/cysteine desulfurase